MATEEQTTAVVDAIKAEAQRRQQSHERVDDLLVGLNLDRFLDDHGRVDATRVASLVTPIATTRDHGREATNVRKGDFGRREAERRYGTANRDTVTTMPSRASTRRGSDGAAEALRRYGNPTGDDAA